MRIFIKFGIGVLYRKLTSRLEFRGNRLIESHNSRPGAHEYLPVLSVFSNQFDRSLGKEIPYNALILFVKLGAVKTALYVRG